MPEPPIGAAPVLRSSMLRPEHRQRKRLHVQLRQTLRVRLAGPAAPLVEVFAQPPLYHFWAGPAVQSVTISCGLSFDIGDY